MTLTIVLVVCWLVWAPIAWRIARSPWGSVEAGLVALVASVYARLVHRLRVEGRRCIPQGRSPGPLIIVANHTAGVDPVLIAAAWPAVAIRFVMAQDMRNADLAWLWTLARVIFVERGRKSVLGIRDALDHLAHHGILGVFPEGRIEHPPRSLLPFHPGVGLFIRRSGARVLPCIIRGTPDIDSAWASLYRPSHAVVRFMPIISYAGCELDEQAIADDLRARFAAWTGWPMVEAPEELNPAHDRLNDPSG